MVVQELCLMQKRPYKRGGLGHRSYVLAVDNHQLGRAFGVVRGAEDRRRSKATPIPPAPAPTTRTRSGEASCLTSKA